MRTKIDRLIFRAEATPPAGSTNVPEAAAPAASATPDVVRYSYDALARLTQKTAQDSSTTTHIYDLASRLTQRDYSDSTTDTFTYDPASRLTQSTKGRYGVTTDHTYAADSQPLTETSTFDGRTYTLARTYDPGNRPLTHTFGDGKIQTWTYNDRNLVTSSSYEANNILTQSHDPARRLTNQTFGNGLTRTITYNRLGNLRTTDIVYDGLQPVKPLSMAYTYSPDKQVTSENFPTGAILVNSSFTATYDPGDRLTSWTRPGQTVANSLIDQTWNYDDNGNWSSTALNGNTERNDRIGSFIDGGEAVARRVYFGRDDQKHQNRTHNADNEKPRRLVGVLDRSEATWGEAPKARGAGLSQLTSGGTAFDDRGNMTEDPDGNDYHYDLDSCPRSAHAMRSRFSSSGKALSLLKLKLQEHCIWKIEMHQGSTIELKYDAMGRRVWHKKGTTKTDASLGLRLRHGGSGSYCSASSLWWGDQEKPRRLVGVLDRSEATWPAGPSRLAEPASQCSEHKHQAGQAVIQNDLWAHPTALNTVIARAVDGSKFKMEWYHKNYLDHVYAVSDDTGDILEHYRYSAFGVVETYTPTGQALPASAISNPIRWNSRRYDEDTQLHYYKYRHYSPKLGRWLSRDPIHEHGGINLYAFLGNDSISWLDVLGLEEVLPDDWQPSLSAIEFESMDDAAAFALLLAGLNQIRDKPDHFEWSGAICCKDKIFKYTGPYKGIERTKSNKEKTLICPDGWEFVAYYHSHPGRGSFNIYDTMITQGFGVWAYVVGTGIDLPEEQRNTNLFDDMFKYNTHDKEIDYARRIPGISDELQRVVGMLSQVHWSYKYDFDSGDWIPVKNIANFDYSPYVKESKEAYEYIKR